VALTLRRSQMFVSLGGPTADDDFDVMDGDARIGRIYYQPATSQPWRWSLSQKIAPEQRGRADTRALALQALSQAHADVGDFGDDVTSVPGRSIEAIASLADMNAKI
jgi:hypothetical protein